MSLMVRSSDEILKEISYLFNEYIQARKTEEKIQNERIDCLEIELDKQLNKNREIAAILTRD
jgi:hypothetical protein